MNSSCTNVNQDLVLLFFILGCLLTILGILLNLCLCALFCRAKSLYKTPYGIFIIALSIADIFKLIAEYLVHILYFFNQSPYFVCSITWFLTISSENLSYAFLCALGIERNLKVWITDRRGRGITRQCAYIITFVILFVVVIHDHPFLLIPYDVSYCFVNLYNHSILFSCDNAYYHSYGYSFSLSDLILIESIGLNNLILPVLIMSTNIVLIFGLRRRANRRRNRLGKRRSDDWREQSVILYVFLSSLTFILLTTPVGLINAWSIVYNQQMATSNLVLLLDLLEIIHHCSHFPILLMTSSVIRRKTFQILLHSRQLESTSFHSRASSQKRIRSKSPSQ